MNAYQTCMPHILWRQLHKSCQTTISKKKLPYVSDFGKKECFPIKSIVSAFEITKIHVFYYAITCDTLVSGTIVCLLVAAAVTKHELLSLSQKCMLEIYIAVVTNVCWGRAGNWVDKDNHRKTYPIVQMCMHSKFKIGTQLRLVLGVLLLGHPSRVFLEGKNVSEKGANTMK